jgi:flagellar motor switch protein FliN/FliY
MSEILSQDQINSLLGQQASAGAAPEGDENEIVGDKAAARDYTVLSSVFELFNEQASTVISTVLNKDISLAIQQCAIADKETITGGAAHEMLLITAPFKSGFSGSLYCIMTKKDVARLSDLMMMGDGTAEFTEDHKDAITELFSQVMGSYTNALAEKTGEQVSNGTVSTSEYDTANLPFSVDASDMAVLSLSIAGSSASRLVFVVPGELSASLTEKMKSTSKEHLDADAPSHNVGLNASELDDLNAVTSPSGDADAAGFTETPLSGVSPSHGVNAPKENVDMLLDIELDVTIELGRTDLSIKRILEMGPGSIVELDRMAGEPVDLLVNNKVVAKGEVVVVDENFGIRIVSLVSPEERIKSLR